MKAKKLKDAIAELIRTGMAVREGAHGDSIPNPTPLRGGFVPTTEEIEAAIDWGAE